MRRIPLPTATPFLLLALAACSGGGGGHRFRVEEIEGTRTARNTGGPRFHEELFAYSERLVLQQDPSVPGSVLTRPAAVTTDGSGNYYVADTGSGRIAVYDAEGRFTRSLGAQGEGPGQWMNLILQGVREGTVSTVDFTRGRLVRYTTAGRLLEELQVPIEWRAGTYALHPLPDRRTVLLNHTVRPDGMVEAMGLVLTDRLRRHWSVSTERFPPEAGAFPCARFEPDLGIVLSTGLDGRLDIYPVDGTPVHRIAVEGLPTPAWSWVGRDDAGYWWLYIPPAGADSAGAAAGSEVAGAAVPGAASPGAAASGSAAPGAAAPAGQSRAGRWRILSPEGEYLGITTTPPLDEVSKVQALLIPVSVVAGGLMGVVTDPASGRAEVRVWDVVPAAIGLVWP